MGIYHGCKHIAVTPTDETQCFVRVAELKPTGEFGSFEKEPVFLSVEDEFKQYEQFDALDDAVLVVKKHIFDLVENKIIERVVCIESCKMSNIKIRKFNAKDEFYETSLQANKDIIEKVQAEVKTLKRILNSKIRVE